MSFEDLTSVSSAWGWPTVAEWNTGLAKKVASRTGRAFLCPLRAGSLHLLPSLLS